MLATLLILISIIHSKYEKIIYIKLIENHTKLIMKLICNGISETRIITNIIFIIFMLVFMVHCGLILFPCIN